MQGSRCGLNPRTSGSRPEPKADAQPLSHPGIPNWCQINWISCHWLNFTLSLMWKLGVNIDVYHSFCHWLTVFCFTSSAFTTFALSSQIHQKQIKEKVYPSFLLLYYQIPRRLSINIHWINERICTIKINFVICAYFTNKILKSIFKCQIEKNLIDIFLESEHPGTPEWLSGWASAFGSGCDPWVPGSSPVLAPAWSMPLLPLPMSASVSLMNK